MKAVVILGLITAAGSADGRTEMRCSPVIVAPDERCSPALTLKLGYTPTRCFVS